MIKYTASGAMRAVCDKCGINPGMTWMPEEGSIMRNDLVHVRWKVNVFDDTKFMCPRCYGLYIDVQLIQLQNNQLKNIPMGYLAR